MLNDILDFVYVVRRRKSVPTKKFQSQINQAKVVVPQSDPLPVIEKKSIQIFKTKHNIVHIEKVQKAILVEDTLMVDRFG